MFILSIRFYLSIVSFHLLRTPLAKQWCDWEAEVGLFNACNINKSYLITFLYILNLGNKALFFFSFHVLQEWEKRLRFCLIFSLSQSHAHHAVVMHCFLLPTVPAEELVSASPDLMRCWGWWDSPEPLCATSAVTKVTLPFKLGPWKRSRKTKWSVMAYKTLPTLTLFVFWQNKSGFACVNIWVTSFNICLKCP